MDRSIVAVVMAGGAGTRLYPAARSDRPKQFRSFGGGESLLARTVDRMGFADDVVVATRPAFADGVRERVPDADVLVEPEPKDTGPALVYAAHRLRERYGSPVLLNVPSDHHVAGDFESVARRAARVAAETGDLVTLGVEPTRPATEYGYVEPGEARSAGFVVRRFVEKPDAGVAADLIERGCLWNAGVFAWTPGALLREARESPLRGLVAALDAGREAPFAGVEPASVDAAVMEQTDRAAVVPADIEWDDLGSWDALARVTDGPLCEALEIDAAGNVIAGDDAHVTAIGVSDLVIAAYDDRVLVVPTDDAQRVREAVAALRERGRF